MRQWTAEIALDVDRARRLIARQFPEFGEVPMELIGTGWDNTVLLVDASWTFRFPRREAVVAGVKREIETLPRLAPNLPLPVPEPTWVGAPDDGYPWPWFGARHLPGTELAATGLPDERRVELGAALGTFLRELHAPRLRSLLGAGLPIDPNRRADMAFRVALTRERLAELAADEVWQAPPDIDLLLADAARLPPSPHISLLHGDVHARHVLVDEDGQAMGIIDWDDVCLGDPAIDLGIAYSAFVGPARSALLEAYGRRVDGLAELRARVIGAFLSAALLGYAVDEGLDALRDESLRGLERVVS